MLTTDDDKKDFIIIFQSCSLCEQKNDDTIQFYICKICMKFICEKCFVHHEC